MIEHDYALGAYPTATGQAPDAPAAGEPAASTSTTWSAGPPVYDAAEIKYALTTSGGTTSSRAWAGDTVTYSIGTGRLSPSSPEYTFEHDGYVAMSPTMEAVAAEAFELWDDLIAIDLVERTNDNSADIGFNYSSNTGGATYARYSYSYASNAPRSDNTLVDANVWLADDWWTHDQDRDLYPGGYGISTYLHEIGHTLGLSHPGNYNGSATFASDADYYQDTRQYTVMSYFDADENGSGTDHFGSQGRSYGATPLLHDILALQAVYGADMTTRTGDTTYGFNATAGNDAFDFTVNSNPVIAIWDAGGIDLIDASGFGTNQRIDLGAGQFSSTGSLTNNLAIAFGAIIEQATGGAGHDWITGNAADNVLRGNAGDDTLEGGAGNDVFHGDDGADVILGGAGIDRLHFDDAGAGVTVDLKFEQGTRGEAAGDRIVSVEDLSGSAHNDILYGGDGAETLAGNNGHDFLVGRGGDDSLTGGYGNDVLRGGEGADALAGGLGRDWANYGTAAAGVTVDLVTGGRGGEATGDSYLSIENVRGGALADEINGDTGWNVIFGGAGDDTLRGEHDNDYLFGEAGDDFLVGGYGDDELAGGAGADTLNGKDGLDWAVYEAAPGGVAVSLQSGFGSAGEAAGDRLIFIEHLRGSAFADTLIGDGGANMIRGGGGNDAIEGGGGNDVLDGQGGADRFVFDQGDGIDRVHNFSLMADLIDFSRTTLAFADLDFSTFRGDAAVAYGSGDVILLTSIDTADLTEQQFLFA